MNNLEVIKNPNSHISEMYKGIRTNIAFSKKHKNVKSIVLTSYQDGEGKSTVTANLSVLFSNIGKKVLIIDANFRNSNLHNIFEVKNDIGLSDALNNNRNIKECIKSTRKENLFILTTGNIVSDFSEIISSNEMKNIIKKLEEDFDYIFIDTPSIGEFSEGCVLSTFCDGVILVVAGGEVDVDNVSIAKDKLNHVGSNILGAIINKYEEI